MKFNELIGSITEKELAFLSAETNVDYQVKKLKGSVMFKLLLYTMLERKDSSLRVMETIFNSSKFKILSESTSVNTKYNSLSDRLTTINVVFFEKLFEHLFKKFSSFLSEKKALQIYDSTMVALSSKLVDWEMKVGAKTNKAQLKFTVGMQGSLPCTFNIFTEKSALCEDKTIPQVILDYKENKSGIVVFDRGVQKRTTFVKFSEEKIIFVSRIKTNVNYKCIEVNNYLPEENKDVQIQDDLKINFIKRGSNKPIETPFRLIKSVRKETKAPIYFITNNFELTPYEIANIYKKRWEIEVYFKFIKQELNFKHLVNRSMNGIKVMMYMTMIMSILIEIYKKENNKKGYKIVKLEIVNEIYDSLLREVVILSGGDPNLITKYLSDG